MSSTNDQVTSMTFVCSQHNRNSLRQGNNNDLLHCTDKNTQQSICSGLMKKETKRQRRFLTETTRGMTVTSMTVTATGMTVMATIMAVTGMEVMAHISCLILEDTN
eukprot:12649246-Ditylum_brightwellii.AAC.1